MVPIISLTMQQLCYLHGCYRGALQMCNKALKNQISIRKSKSSRQLTFITPKKSRSQNSSNDFMNRHIISQDMIGVVLQTCNKVKKNQIPFRQSNNCRQLTFITPKNPKSQISFYDLMNRNIISQDTKAVILGYGRGSPLNVLKVSET